MRYPVASRKMVAIAMTHPECEVFVAGQFPPPVNGFSYITKELAGLLAARCPATVIDLSPHGGGGSVLYHARRFALALSGVAAILKRGTGATGLRIYLACEGGFGLAYTIMLALAARGVGAPVYLHHHSFYYIDRNFPLMDLLLKILGANVTHIFLSTGMARRYAARYRRSLKGLVLSNSAFVEPQPVGGAAAVSWQEKKAQSSITIGLLSNLSEEKGLGRFIATLRAAKANGLNVKGVLAGPASTEHDRQTIESARRELGDMLEYRGPLYGDDKLAYYGEIDVFAFPTSYPNEAQPTVIYEAMSRGVPVLSFNRGCIAEQVGKAGAVAEQDVDFAVFAIEHLRQWLSDPEAFARLRLDTLKLFLEDRAKAHEAARNLLSLTPETIAPL